MQLQKVLTQHKKVQNFRFHPVIAKALDEYIKSQKEKGISISKNSFLEELLYHKLIEGMNQDEEQ